MKKICLVQLNALWHGAPACLALHRCLVSLDHLCCIVVSGIPSIPRATPIKLSRLSWLHPPLLGWQVKTRVQSREKEKQNQPRFLSLETCRLQKLFSVHNGRTYLGKYMTEGGHAYMRMYIRDYYIPTYLLTYVHICTYDGTLARDKHLADKEGAVPCEMQKAGLAHQLGHLCLSTTIPSPCRQAGRTNKHLVLLSLSISPLVVLRPEAGLICQSG